MSLSMMSIVSFLKSHNCWYTSHQMNTVRCLTGNDQDRPNYHPDCWEDRTFIYLVRTDNTPGLELSFHSKLVSQFFLKRKIYSIKYLNFRMNLSPKLWIEMKYYKWKLKCDFDNSIHFTTDNKSYKFNLRCPLTFFAFLFSLSSN